MNKTLCPRQAISIRVILRQEPAQVENLHVLCEGFLALSENNRLSRKGLPGTNYKVGCTLNIVMIVNYATRSLIYCCNNVYSTGVSYATS